MKIFFPFILFVSLTSGAFASTTPLNLLHKNLENIKENSQTIEGLTCENYKDSVSNISCEYLKAFSLHQQRKYDKAHQHAIKLSNALHHISNFKLMGIDQITSKKMIEHNIDMYASAFESVEDGNLNAMSIDSLIAALTQGGGEYNRNFGAAAYITQAIIIFYERKKTKSIKELYLTLGKKLISWQLTVGSPTKFNSSTAYKSILSNLIIGDQMKRRHTQLVKSLWQKIPENERSINLDVLVDTYLKSGRITIEQKELNAAFNKLNLHENNANDIKTRLYAIHIVSLMEAIPESKRFPPNPDYSHFLSRYYHLLDSEYKIQFKTAITEATNIVINKNAPKSSIDEFIVATYITYRDLIKAPKHKSEYYKLLDKKYSVLMKDYLDFTDQSSKEYSAINSLGSISRIPMGEGLM